ncbi:hypothetical protein NQZ68_030903 [Dissostichus eleginoides]|nr:hypothetical protein NQZ68_030903 [Dissostichus eleginoides]
MQPLTVLISTLCREASEEGEPSLRGAERDQTGTIEKGVVVNLTTAVMAEKTPAAVQCLEGLTGGVTSGCSRLCNDVQSPECGKRGRRKGERGKEGRALLMARQLGGAEWPLELLVRNTCDRAACILFEVEPSAGTRSQWERRRECSTARGGARGHTRSTPSDGDEVAAATDPQSNSSVCTADLELFFQGGTHR